MTILAADRETDRKEGTLLSIPIVAAEIIYKGAMVMYDADGYATAGQDTTACIFAGVAFEKIDNSAGASGALSVRVYRPGLFKFACSNMAQTRVGDMMYVGDDQTFYYSTQSTNYVKCGKLAYFESSTAGWIDITSGLA